MHFLHLRPIMSGAALSSMMANRLAGKLARVDASMEAITSVSKLLSLNYGEKSAAAVAISHLAVLSRVKAAVVAAISTTQANAKMTAWQ